MSMSVIEKMKLKNSVERVLHVPGNFTQSILEMAIVMDCSFQKEEIVSLTKEIVGILKTQSDVFRNVRLNTILWKGEGEFVEKVTAMPFLQMGTFFEDYQEIACDKTWDELLHRLKVFYARSKLILILSHENFDFKDKVKAKENLQPFLYRKLIVLDEKNITLGMDLMKITINS